MNGRIVDHPQVDVNTQSAFRTSCRLECVPVLQAAGHRPKRAQMREFWRDSGLLGVHLALLRQKSHIQFS